MSTLPATPRHWQLQLGTLGSGNHFIEISLDEDDRVWLFLHSGSRGVGNKIAQHHIAVAQRLARQWWISLPDRDLAYLVEGTDEFAAYLRDLGWAQHFALLNREEMMDRVVDLRAGLGRHGDRAGRDGQLPPQLHRARERHFGKDVWVSRKGAIDAQRGRARAHPGLRWAPGPTSSRARATACRCAPHRTAPAVSTAATPRAAAFTQDDLRAAMVGIEYRDTDAFVDEIPSAYKDIDVVMADAADLVEVRHTLRQVVNVKGD